MKKFKLVTQCKGYRSREDITNLEPGYLVKGSRDVLTNSANRVGVRLGYTLDGAANPALHPIESSYDWNTHIGQSRHTRSHTSTLEYRYVNTSNVVSWRTLASAFSNVAFNYAEFWRREELADRLLFVNGTTNIFEWSGGITTFASATANTITKQGATTWAEEGFYFSGNIVANTIAFVNSNPDTITDAGNGFIAAGFYAGQRITVSGAANPGNNNTFTIRSVTAGTITLIATDALTAEAAGAVITIHSVRQVTIGGIVYTYTGGESTTTLTGVTPNPTLGGHVAGDVIHQTIRTIPTLALVGIGSSFKISLISTLYNQVYIGSLVERTIYASYADNYCNFTSSTPRAANEGGSLTLDGCPTGFVPQEDEMYISAGKDQWYRTQFESFVNSVVIGGVQISTNYENLDLQRLKTNSLTAARYQNYISKDDNKVIYLNFEPSIDTLGRVDNIFAIPDITNISDPIRDDMNAYDFDNPLGDIAFWKNFWYISVPAEGLVLVFNVAKKWWECPQMLPVGKFSIIDGELYGHSAHVPETYKLFTGFNDNNHPILAQAIFSFQNFGTRANLKSFNEMYVEGYISSNTDLTLGIQYEIDGCATNTFYDILGNDAQIVCLGGDDNSLGKHPLGSYPLGTLFFGPNDQTLPPKFRVIKTFPRKDFFEVQFAFSSYGVDQRWELLAFGPEVTLSKNDSVYIKQ